MLYSFMIDYLTLHCIRDETRREDSPLQNSRDHEKKKKSKAPTSKVSISRDFAQLFSRNPRFARFGFLDSECYVFSSLCRFLGF